MTNGEAINWIINISADIGKAEHRDLWHYEQALSEIRDMLESEQPEPSMEECACCVLSKPQQRWIPCSERLPEERQEILATTTDNAWGDVVIIRTYYKEMHKSVIAWMPLPEPYEERRTDESD